MSKWMFEMLPEGAFEPRPDGKMRLHGGKGGNQAPAPDPRLVEAQIRSMGVQDSAIQAILANTQDMAPLQKEQMQVGIDSARLAQTQSQQDRDWMLTRRGSLSGLQDKLVTDASTFSTEDKANELAAKAMADVNQGFANAEGQQARSMARMGVNPSSGKSLAMGNQAAIAKAAALAAAGTGARDRARQEGYALTDRATNALAGYPTMSMQATGAGAQYGASGAALAAQGIAGLNSGFGAAGSLAGQMGQNATNMYGTQSRDYYADQGGDSFGSILGGLGGLAAGGAKLWALSDRRLKENIVLVGVHDATGLPLYEFSYLNSAARYRGVMADDVVKVMPEAVRREESGFDSVNYALLGIDMVEV